MWMICKGSNSKQLHIFVATLYVSNRTAGQNAHRLEKQQRKERVICVSGVNQKCFESCVFTLYVPVLGQCTRYSNDTASLLPQPTFVAEVTLPSGQSYHFLMQPSGDQYLHISCSLSTLTLQHHTTTNTALFLAEWPLKPVHEASLSTAHRTTALWGNLNPL